MTIFDNTYRNGDDIEISGVLCAVATKSGTTPKQVWFRKSADGGATWSAAVQVGTLASGSSAKIRAAVEKKSGRLVVSNGIDTVYQSDDLGRTWAAI